MKWEIGFSREAEKFLKRKSIRPEAVNEIIKFIKRIKEVVSTSKTMPVIHFLDRVDPAYTFDDFDSRSLLFRINVLRSNELNVPNASVLNLDLTTPLLTVNPKP
jgi:hypothetical protein